MSLSTRWDFCDFNWNQFENLTSIGYLKSNFCLLFYFLVFFLFCILTVRKLFFTLIIFLIRNNSPCHITKAKEATIYHQWPNTFSALDIHTMMYFQHLQALFAISLVWSILVFFFCALSTHRSLLKWFHNNIIQNTAKHHRNPNLYEERVRTDQDLRAVTTRH
jgi:hypothetical protein